MRFLGLACWGRGLSVMCVALAAACVLTPTALGAGETAKLHASFTPDRLGASTTIGFGFQIEGGGGTLPSPLRGVQLSLPPGINYLSTTLGLAVCNPHRLLTQGLSGCPANSRLGFGSAYVEVPFGASRGREIPDIQAIMGPPKNGNIVVLFYAEGREPVYAQIVFQGELLAGTRVKGGSLNTLVPLVPSVPDGPPVSILRVHATIGPRHLTYQERVHGRLVHFHPKGVAVPLHCPRGGFPFAAVFSFQDGTTATASTKVPCPAKQAGSKRSAGRQATGKKARAKHATAAPHHAPSM